MTRYLDRAARIYWLVIGVALGWALWASAQESATNTPTAPHEPARGLTRLVQVDEEYLTFGLDKVDLLSGHRLFGQPLWKYLAFAIYVALALAVSKALDWVLSGLLRRWAAKTATTLDDLLVELLRGPVKIVAFVIFLHIGLNIFTWGGWFQAWVSKGLQIVVACSITYVAVKCIDLGMGYWRQSKGDSDALMNDILFPIITKSLKVFVVVVAVLITSQNMGINMTGAIASLSIGGLALGLAAQDTVANFFGAVSVIIDKPFRIGDRIKLGEVDGLVETIGLRSTRVRNLDGHLITVPNKTMGNATITNITRRTNIKTEMNIGVTYDTSAERIKRAIEILNQVYRADPMTFDVQVAFNRFDESALNLQVVHWWNSTDYKAYLAGMQELNLKVKEWFDREGIEFAFPTQTLHLKSPAEASLLAPPART